MAKNVPGNASGCITIATAFFCTLFSDGKREKHPEREAMAEMQTLPFFCFRNWYIIQVRKISLSEHWRVETGRRVSSLVRTKPSHGEGRKCDGHTRTMGCCWVDLLSRGQCWNPHRLIRCYHPRSSVMRLPHCTGCAINQSHIKCTEGGTAEVTHRVVEMKSFGIQRKVFEFRIVSPDCNEMALKIQFCLTLFIKSKSCRTYPYLFCYVYCTLY